MHATTTQAAGTGPRAAQITQIRAITDHGATTEAPDHKADIARQLRPAIITSRDRRS
jgi:hypothetical protein